MHGSPHFFGPRGFGPLTYSFCFIFPGPICVPRGPRNFRGLGGLGPFTVFSQLLRARVVIKGFSYLGTLFGTLSRGFTRCLQTGGPLGFIFSIFTQGVTTPFGLKNPWKAIFTKKPRGPHNSPGSAEISGFIYRGLIHGDDFFCSTRSRQNRLFNFGVGELNPQKRQPLLRVFFTFWGENYPFFKNDDLLDGLI